MTAVDFAGRLVSTTEQQHRGRDHVFGDGERVGARRRYYPDAARCARLRIDVVETDAEASDDA